MRARLFPLLLLPLFACGASSTDDAKANAIARLETETHASWTLSRDVTTARPSTHLATRRRSGGTTASLTPADSVVRARELLARHPELLTVRDATRELAIKSARTDDLGMTHVRLEQVVRGVPVLGAEVFVHFDAAGAATTIDSSYIPGIDTLDVVPRITAAQAVDAARAEIGLSPSEAPDATDAKLIVFALDEKAPRLAYQHRVPRIHDAEPAIWMITIDARTGEVIHRYNDLQSVVARGKGVLGDTKTFEVSKDGNAYVMVDESRKAVIETYTAGYDQVQPGDLVRSQNLESWDVGGAGAGSAVDAHAYAGMVYDYYAKKHNRAGIDGQNGPLVSTVHYDKNFVNAFFDGTQMVYGDGDDKEARSLAGALDIVGHEFTHGVTAATSGLIYIGQWGALNESVSDVFGCFVEHVNQPSEKGNWKNGEAIGLDPTFVRDLANPHNGNAQPAHMNEYRLTLIDNGGVHINSGIPNNAAYLMTMGGKNPVSGVEVAKGIGWEKAEKVWYRANAEYFGRTTMFRTAALDTIDAAIDLGLTDAEVDAVECAWIAVGVLGGDCKQAPQEQNQANTPKEGRGAGSGEESGEAGTKHPTRDGDSPLAPASAGGCSQSRNQEAPNGAVASILALLAGLATARIRRARR